jgi:hypothetical protein
VDGQLLRREVQRLSSRDKEDYTIVVHRVERKNHHPPLEKLPPLL